MTTKSPGTARASASNAQGTKRGARRWAFGAITGAVLVLGLGSRPAVAADEATPTLFVSTVRSGSVIVGDFRGKLEPDPPASAGWIREAEAPIERLMRSAVVADDCFTISHRGDENRSCYWIRNVSESTTPTDHEVHRRLVESGIFRRIVYTTSLDRDRYAADGVIPGGVEVRVQRTVETSGRIRDAGGHPDVRPKALLLVSLLRDPALTRFVGRLEPVYAEHPGDASYYDDRIGAPMRLTGYAPEYAEDVVRVPEGSESVRCGSYELRVPTGADDADLRAFATLLKSRSFDLVEFADDAARDRFAKIAARHPDVTVTGRGDSGDGKRRVGSPPPESGAPDDGPGGRSRPATSPPRERTPEETAEAAIYDRITVDLLAWDRAGHQARIAATRDSARRVEGFRADRLVHFELGGVSREVGILVHEATSMEFALVPGGVFEMGVGATRRPVRISRPFLVARTEMSQGVWSRLVGSNPSEVVGERRPVEHVSWQDADALARRLGLALPTEAQWEYACRAGTSTLFASGDNEASLDGHANVLDRCATQSAAELPPAVRSWIQQGEVTLDVYDGAATTAPVGSYRPNAFGLQDMHGNVAEWCADWDGSLSNKPEIDPTGPATGELRVIRGGCWALRGWNAASAWRSGVSPTARSNIIGVRFVKSL